MKLNRRERIAVDMDNVIADLDLHCINWYFQKYKKYVKKSDLYIRSELKKEVLDFLFTPGFFLDIPVMPGAHKALVELSQRYDIFIVSAAMEFPQSLSEKYAWMMKNFSFISWKNLVFCGNKSIIEADYIIDDYPKNLDSFNGKGILFSAAHNLTLYTYLRVNNWNDVITLFNKEKWT
jgi:5'-nucleotidase